jgi:hypothetical protein
MKNLHVLPTDKPSRLFLNKVNNKLLLDSDTYCDLIKRLPSSNYQNIYITSDEEIKQGDYFWKPDCNMIFKAEYTPHKGCKKVILTTDTDLIKDGVQPIDDEFLNWFVDNPSCEGVEVADLWKDGNPSTHFSYQIIIPHEEPKQETLEEAADKYRDLKLPDDLYDGFIAGAKYQSERMYSEEEMLLVLNIGFTSTDETWEECVAFAKEQFKKK